MRLVISVLARRSMLARSRPLDRRCARPSALALERAIAAEDARELGALARVADVDLAFPSRGSREAVQMRMGARRQMRASKKNWMPTADRASASGDPAGSCARAARARAASPTTSSRLRTDQGLIERTRSAARLPRIPIN